MKIVSKGNSSDSVHLMRDGDIAEIVDFPDQPKVKGLIIQRYGRLLITLGENSEKTWSTLLGLGATYLEPYRVNILPKGTQLEI